MSFKDLKITTYQDSVSALPDYPSDAGITAAQLKAVFDGRTDKEIKEKHNGLVDAVGAKIDEIETNIERRAADVDAQFADIETRKLDKNEFKSFEAANETILEGKADREELASKVDKVSGKGLSTNDFTNERSMAIDDAFYEAIYAQAELDRHMFDKNNPHKVTAAQMGVYTKAETDELHMQYVKNTDYANNSKGGVIKSVKSYGTEVNSGGAIKIVKATQAEIDARVQEYHPIVPENLEYAVKSVGDDYYATKAEVGDIETALDAILAIQNELIGGDN